MAAPSGTGGGGPPLPDIQQLRSFARDDLIHLLRKVAGHKDLVMDGELMKPLDRLAGAILLRENGVGKIFKLGPTKLPSTCEQCLFMVRPYMVNMKYIADHINAQRTAGQKKKYSIIMVPRRLHVCDLILEQEGVFGFIDIHEFALDVVPLDTDILSLHLPQYFSSFFLHNDQTWCHTVAKSLVNIQETFGLIPNMYCQGRSAKKVHSMMKSFFSYQETPPQLKSEIGHLFLIDRDVDYVTPMCFQMTYEGLLDDTFGISSGFVEFGPEVSGTDKNIKLLLTSQDPVFEEIRNQHFSGVSRFLGGKAKELQSLQNKKNELKSVTDMKNYVANELKDLNQQKKALALHIGACEVIIKNTKGDFEEQLRTEHSLLEGVDTKENISFIEEMINRQFDQNLVLRMLCLLSLTQDGLSQSNYKSLRTQFLQSYGFDNMPTIYNLKKLGLLEEQDLGTAPTLPKQLIPKNLPMAKQLGKVATSSLTKAAGIVQRPRKSQFRAVSKKLNLIPKSAEDIDLRNPRDMSYVFSGAYTPVSCKLVEQVLQKEGFTGLDDVTKLLPGPSFSEVKAKSVRGKAGQSSHASDSPASRVVLVYFLGGCTFSEIAALRFLGKQKGYSFIIAATTILNGKTLIDLASEKV